MQLSSYEVVTKQSLNTHVLGINKPKRTVILMETGSLHLQGFKRPLNVADLRKKLES